MEVKVSDGANRCNWGVPILTLDGIDLLDHLKEFPCPDKTCDGTVVFLENARFFRKQEDEDPWVDLGFETSTWQCQICHLYVLPVERLQQMTTTTLEEAFAAH